MTIKEYEAVKAMRVSEIVKFAVGDIDSIIKDTLYPRETTEAIRIGVATHSLLLRTDRSGIPDDIAIIDFESYRSKEAQKLKNEAEGQGKTPLLITQYDNIMRGLNFAEKELNQFFDPSKSKFEVSFFATDEYFGEIKGRLDCIYDNKFVNDLKVSAQTAMLDKKIFDMGYQLQMYIYMQLAQLEQANIVFFNPETYIVRVKRFDIDILRKECTALLGRAMKNKELFDKYQKGEMGVVDSGEYLTPQWAFQYLIEG